MSDSKQKEILDFLQSYPAGQIYTLVPKQYIVRGFDYYRRGSLRKLEWNEDFSVLTAKVRGTKLYSGVRGQVLFLASGLPEYRDSYPSQIPRYLNQHRLICLSRDGACVIGVKQPSEATLQFVPTKIRQLLDILPNKGLYRLYRLYVSPYFIRA